MSIKDLWYGTSGPRAAEVVVVGESWGAEELAQDRPFVGSSGVELNRMLADAGIQRDNILATNVIAAKPPGNETWRFFLPKASVPASTPRIGGLLPSPEITSELQRLYSQLLSHPRKLVIACGNYALWSLSQVTGSEVLRQSNNRAIPPELQTWAPNGIMSWRGSMLYVDPHEGFCASSEAASRLRDIPLLPIIHPAAILRDWEQRAPTVHDLKTRVPKALRYKWRPNPSPNIITAPDYTLACNILDAWIYRADREPVVLANDIETVRRRFISVMGFADSPNFAMCIPFISGQDPDGAFLSFYEQWEEAAILHRIRKLLTHPNVRIVGQNYIYDTQFIQVEMGVTPRLWHDTMLAQNVIFPGTPKDLSYLSSMYCDYHWYWKDDVKDWNDLGDLQALMDYNCVDVLRTWEICESQRAYIRAIGQEEQMAFKMRTNDLCLRMMNRGVRIDTQRRGRVLFEMQEAAAALERELLTIVPQDMVRPLKKRTDTMWYRSDKWTKELFYSILGFRTVLHRKTGRPTSGKEAIMKLRKQYPEFRGLLDRIREYSAVDNVIGVIKTPAEHDERMRCSYNPGGTETHRLSSSENVFGRGTNLQNLTKGEEDD